MSNYFRAVAVFGFIAVTVILIGGIISTCTTGMFISPYAWLDVFSLITIAFFGYSLPLLFFAVADLMDSQISNSVQRRRDNTRIQNLERSNNKQVETIKEVVHVMTKEEPKEEESGLPYKVIFKKRYFNRVKGIDIQIGQLGTAIEEKGVNTLVKTSLRGNEVEIEVPNDYLRTI